MLKGICRAATALIMSVVVILPISARPARAAIDWTTVVAAGINALSAYLTSSNTAEAIRQATTQILAAVNGAKTDILAGIETIAVAEARACANHAVIEFIDIERMTPDNMQRFAQDATWCTVSIISLLPAVTGKARIDQLGFALNVVGPIALNARARTGLTTSALEASLHGAENTLVSAITTDYCYITSSDIDPELPTPRDGDPIDWDIWCDAYYAYLGLGYNYVLNLPWPTLPSDADMAVAENMALRNTSRAIAISVLPLFRY